MELLVEAVLHREVRHQRSPRIGAHLIEHRANVGEHKIAGGAAVGRGEAGASSLR
jgi:hypothetical protein